MPLRLSVLLLVLIAAAGVLPADGARGETLVVQTDMYGSETVPPVRTVAYGFVRFFFDETRRNVEYTVDVKGLSGTLVLGADIHRGPPGSNGPVVKHLADGGFIVTSGRLRLSPRELEEMLSGNWYVVVRSRDNPDGEMRGQITLPQNFLPPSATPEPPPPPVALQTEAEPLPAPEIPAPAVSVPAVPAAPRLDVRILPPNTGDGGFRR